jgi:hypothetical protein
VSLQSSVSRLATLLGAKGTQAGDDARLMMLVLHDDVQHEYAYGQARGLPDTHVGTLSDALMVEAGKSGWNVISMKNDGSAFLHSTTNIWA